jgi:outer membrane protein assembly factor BamE (lipoprotein component of BamABCDE complex)
LCSKEKNNMTFHRMRLPLMAAALLVATFAAAGCSSSDSSTTPTEMAAPTEAAMAVPTDVPAPVEAPEVVIEAVDYSYSGPAEVPAGMTKLTVANKGQDLHQVALMQLAEGKTFDDFTAYAKTAEESAGFPEWAQPAGGPAVAVPGAQASAFVDLQPGTYVMLCGIPDAEGVPHFQKGQISPLTVTAATAASAAAPVADITVKEEDFAFGMPSEVAAGPHVFEAVNGGGQPHEAVLVMLNEGATAKDVAAAFAPGGSGQPPALPLGGSAPHMVGASGTFPVDLQPGRYALLCFLTDPATGKAHTELGMMAEFDAK